MHVMCGVAEYDELPVRHNEDKINTTLAGEVRWPTDSRSADDPHTKANLLLQVTHLPEIIFPGSCTVCNTDSVAQIAIACQLCAHAGNAGRTYQQSLSCPLLSEHHIQLTSW